MYQFYKVRAPPTLNAFVHMHAVGRPPKVIEARVRRGVWFAPVALPSLLKLGARQKPEARRVGFILQRVTRHYLCVGWMPSQMPHRERPLNTV